MIAFIEAINYLEIEDHRQHLNSTAIASQGRSQDIQKYVDKLSKFLRDYG